MSYNIIDSYCVTTKEQIYIKGMRTAQFTLNGRVFPSKRQSVALTERICKEFPETNIVVHYDFIYLLSKLHLFSKEVSSAVLTELVSLLNIKAPNFLGVVMHTSSPYQKAVRQAENKIFAIDAHYKQGIFDMNNLKEYVNYGDELLLSMGLQTLLSYDTIKPIFLETMAKPDSISYHTLTSMTRNDYERAGICYDTEHVFASQGETWWPTKNLGQPFLVHLNAIPDSVQPSSGLDRHSETTVFECSLRNYQSYLDYVNLLNSINIPYVREVKYEAMHREQKQILNYVKESALA